MLRLIIALTTYLSLDTDPVYIKSAFMNVDHVEEIGIMN